MPQDFNPRAVIGDNNPPLAELLPVETEALKDRADKLLAGSERAAVTDDETAGKAIELAKMIGDHIKTIDKARVERKEPFLVAGREVDAFFKGLAAPLDEAKVKVVKMIDGYRAEQERKRKAEQARIEAEARALREANEKAERERLAAEQRAREAEEAARAAGDREAAEKAAKERAQRELEAEIAVRKAREAEELKAKEAAALAAPTVTRSEYGATASGRKVRSGEITELRPLLSYLIKANEAGLREALQPLVDRLIKAGLPEIPGVTITTETKTVIR